MTSCSSITLPEDGPFVLRGVTLPSAFCGPDLLPGGATGLVRGDLGIADGRFAVPSADWPVVDASERMALPPFTDAHVHLDKAFTIGRTGMGDGTLLGAIRVMAADADNWMADDLLARMRHAASRALAHGTGTMRSHLDTIALPDETPSWDVLADVQAQLRGLLTIEPVALAAVERAEQPDFDARCAQIARRGGVLGAFVALGAVPHDAIAAFLAGAERHGLDVDFHVDENLIPGESALAAIADRMIRTRHAGRVVAGHACKLSLLPDDALARVLDRVAEACIHVIALPSSNLYLQDRGDGAPRRRGIAPLKEMIARGIAVCTASDNVQDAFYPFGDFDMIEVLRSTIVCGHLDGDICTALDLGLGAASRAIGGAGGRLERGGPADLTLFNARDWFSLLAAPQGGRIVIRGGRAIAERAINWGEAA